ncbi:MAG: ribonucleotide-diphosphate reductase subunit alpha, partial [Patescibacteria group bacterium]
NPVPHLGRLEATNPCGEQWLHDGDVCNLGSINLSKFIRNGKLDEERLKYVTRMSTRMLDNVIDISDFPVEKVNQRFRDNRRVGLGLMGFADLLYQLRIGYDTQEGLDMARYTMKLINETSIDESIKLAEKKGVFPNWEKSIFGPGGANIRRRNAALTTVAPTGSISMILDCSSGVEPFFALAYYKEVMGGQKLPYVNQFLERELKDRGLFSEEIMDKIIKSGSIQGIPEIPEDMKKVYVTAMDIGAADHTLMQAAFQEHVENSISKTINFPNSATMEDVENGYILAWEKGCKGCTVYRDGSRQEQVLNLHKEEKTPEQALTHAEEANGRPHRSLEVDATDELKKNKICPECKSTVKMAEGCILCITCGFSACAV